MVLIPVHCPHCQSEQVIKGGKTQVGTQRYKCQNVDCPHYSFQLDLTYKGRSPAIKERIIDMALNGSGIRDTARVLQISPTTVINELKKRGAPQQCELPSACLVEPGYGDGRHSSGGRGRSGRDVVVCRQETRAAVVMARD
jgi:transposase-like protein